MEEEEEAWEERDDRGNLWARGREMKREEKKKGQRGGRGGPGVPLTAVLVSCCLLSSQHTVYKHTHMASL